MTFEKGPAYGATVRFGGGGEPGQGGVGVGSGTGVAKHPHMHTLAHQLHMVSRVSIKHLKQTSGTHTHDQGKSARGGYARVGDHQVTVASRGHSLTRAVSRTLGTQPESGESFRSVLFWTG
jgi:hypothetical protein